MINCKKVLINEKEFIKTFSDKNFYIKDNNNILYSIAYDLEEKEYQESDILIK